MSAQKFEKLFLFGIDRAGKTALTNIIKGENPEGTRPTLAFNLVTLDLEDLRFQIWDAPGQKNLRRIWNNGFNRAKFMIFVVDTSDSDRFEESKTEFEKVINEEDTKGLAVIFLFNKMDLEKAKENVDNVKKIFALNLYKDREIIEIETSIYDKESIDKIRQNMIELARKIKSIAF